MGYRRRHCTLTFVARCTGVRSRAKCPERPYAFLKAPVVYGRAILSTMHVRLCSYFNVHLQQLKLSACEKALQGKEGSSHLRLPSSQQTADFLLGEYQFAILPPSAYSSKSRVYHKIDFTAPVARSASGKDYIQTGTGTREWLSRRKENS